MACTTPEYLPSEAEINYRAKAVAWLSAQGWSTDLVNSIMYDDEPPIHVVERLVRRHGAEKAYELIQRMAK